MFFARLDEIDTEVSASVDGSSALEVMNAMTPGVMLKIPDFSDVPDVLELDQGAETKKKPGVVKAQKPRKATEDDPVKNKTSALNDLEKRSADIGKMELPLKHVDYGGSEWGPYVSSACLLFSDVLIGFCLLS